MITQLQYLKVDYIVAPYEADAQLAFLYKKALIDIVITEDSDLLLFGATKVFFKMTTHGNGIEIDLKDLHKCDVFSYLEDYAHLSEEKRIEIHQEMLLLTCIFSGCDYLESIKGIGFKRALKLVMTHRGQIRDACQEIASNNQYDINIDRYMS